MRDTRYGVSPSLLWREFHGESPRACVIPSQQSPFFLTENNNLAV